MIQGQRKKFKKKNWIQNFRKILKRERNKHLLLKIPKKMGMERTRRINRLRGQMMKKQSLRRKAMMKRKAAK